MRHHALIPIALLFAAGFGCDFLPECDPLMSVGSIDDQVLPDGSTLEPWVERLSNVGSDLDDTRWTSDGSPAGMTAVLTEYAEDVLLQDETLCESAKLTTTGEATIGGWPNVFAGPVIVARWGTGLTNSLFMNIDSDGVTLDEARAPFEGWRDHDLRWTFELHDLGVEIFASLRWTSSIAIEIDGVDTLGEQVLYTPGHPWTDLQP